MDAKRDWIDQMRDDLREAKARIAALERQLAEEKALGDRLYAAYRKARGR